LLTMNKGEKRRATSENEQRIKKKSRERCKK
jgi:hypothetical protein